MDKRYIDANELLQDSFRLAVKIFASGFRPKLLVGVWRGGSPVAIAIHEYLSYMGWESDHIPIRAVSYTGINQRTKEVKLTGLEYIFKHVNKNDQILIIDDVFDTGNSYKAVIDALVSNFDSSVLKNVKIACPWYKPENNQTQLIPDYYLHETDQWLVFPHELIGESEEDLQQNKLEILKIISDDN